VRIRWILWSYVILSTGHVLSKGLAFLSAVAIGRALGPHQTGLFGTATTFLLFAWVIADCGVGTIGGRLVASNPALTRNLDRNVFLIRLAGAALAVSLGSLAVVFFGGPSSILLPLCLSAIVYAFRRDWLLLGLGRIPAVAGAAVLRDLTFLLLSIGIVSSTKSLEAAVWSFFGAELVWSLVTTWAVRGANSQSVATSQTRSLGLYSQGWPVALMAMMTLTYNKIDTPLIAWLRGPAEAGVYWAAYTIVFGVLGFSAVLSRAAFPEMARTSAPGQPRDMSQTMRLSMIGAGAGALASILVSTWAPQLIRLAYGPKYAAGAGALSILAWCLWPNFSAALLLQRLVVDGRQRILAGGALIAAALNVGLNVLIIPRLGMLGAAGTSVASETCLLMLAIFAYRKSLWVGRFLAAQVWLGVAMTAAIWVGGRVGFHGDFAKGILILAIFVLLSAPIATGILRQFDSLRPQGTPETPASL